MDVPTAITNRNPQYAEEFDGFRSQPRQCVDGACSMLIVPICLGSYRAGQNLSEHDS